MIGRRQLRLRVLETLERRVKQFRSREELWPLRVPHEPVLLDDVVQEALGPEARTFDRATLRSRTLLRLEWDDDSAWDAWVVVVPSQVKVYCDSGEEMRILASGGRNEGDETDRIFLQLLADSAGEHFGIEMSGGAPSRVRSSITDRAFLIDVFVDLFEVTGMESAIRADLEERGMADGDDDVNGADFRSDVERWLRRALKQ